MSSNIGMNLHRTTAAKTGRMIGFSAFSLIAWLYFGGLCTAGLLHVMGAVSLARLASSTIFIVGVATASLIWALWRVYQMQRACDDSNCPSLRWTWLTSIFSVAAFVVDVAF